MTQLILLLFVLLLASRNTNGLAPQGCTYEAGRYTCDFQEWTPPLQDEDFDPGPLYFLIVTNINGTIPAGAFSGLNGPPTKKNAYLYFYCYFGKTSLSRDIFTENLHWLTQLYIDDCYLETGLPSRLLENLKSLVFLTIRGGGIEGPVAHDALAGLTNLLEFIVRAPIKYGELPHGFFYGLKHLTAIFLTHSALYSIPPNWFDGLVSLDRIYLGNNNLQTLPLGLFDGLRSLTHVGLNSNPWNCSCELSWLLTWSNITAGAYCKEPSEVANVKLEEAMVMIDCMPSPSTISLASRSATTEMTAVEKSSVPTFSASSKLNQTNATHVLASRSKTAISLKQEWATSTSTSTKIITMTLTSEIIPVIINATILRRTRPATITSSTRRIPTASWETSTKDAKVATHFWSSLSSNLSTPPVNAQTFYSFTQRGSVSPDNSNTEDNIANCRTNIGLIIGVGGTPTVLLVTATVIYRRACKNKRIRSVDDAETHEPEPQSRDGSNIS